MCNDMDVAYWMAKYDQLAEDYTKLNCHYATALSKITELENQWISVNDRLPEPYEDVLVCMYLPFRERNKQAVTLSYYLGDDEGYFFDEDAGVRVTHWLPLPALPEREDDTDGKDDRGS